MGGLGGITPFGVGTGLGGITADGIGFGGITAEGTGVCGTNADGTGGEGCNVGVGRTGTTALGIGCTDGVDGVMLGDGCCGMTPLGS